MLPLLAALSMVLTQGTDSLRSAIEARIKQNPTAEVGVAYIDLQSGDTLYIHADTVIHAASTMKVPVMLELYRRVSAGGISLDQGLLIVNQFASIVDGSPYAQDPGQDLSLIHI